MNTPLKKLVGYKAHYIKFFRTIRAVPFSVKMPVFGIVSTVDEVLNIHDNFSKSELRHEEIENHLRQAPAPVILDCGVNVGITVRWWHHLNPRAKIFGFDMMEEAHTFTRNQIGALSDWYVPVTCALSAADGEAIEVSFDDPLFGENSVTATNRKNKRKLNTCTLDFSLRQYNLTEIDLIKMDIEGYGAEALKGGTDVLRKTRYVMFETHTKREMSEATEILHDTGFQVIGMRARTLVFERKNKATLNE